MILNILYQYTIHKYGNLNYSNWIRNASVIACARCPSLLLAEQKESVLQPCLNHKSSGPGHKFSFFLKIGEINLVMQLSAAVICKMVSGSLG